MTYYVLSGTLNLSRSLGPCIRLLCCHCYVIVSVVCACLGPKSEQKIMFGRRTAWCVYSSGECDFSFVIWLIRLNDSCTLYQWMDT